MTDTFRALCAELLAADDGSIFGTDLVTRARAALVEPVPPAEASPTFTGTFTTPAGASISGFALLEEVPELVLWLREIAQLWESDAPRSKQLARAADLLECLVAEPEGPSDDELLKLTENISTKYLCKHKSLPSDWDPGDYASSTKGLIEFARAVLARWGRP